VGLFEVIESRGSVCAKWSRGAAEEAIEGDSCSQNEFGPKSFLELMPRQVTAACSGQVRLFFSVGCHGSAQADPWPWVGHPPTI